MLRKKSLVIALMIAGTATIKAQNVGVGTSTPNKNAILDVTVPDPATAPQGMLLPRLTTTQKTALAGSLAAVDEGMVVYDTDINSMFMWDGAAWVNVSAVSGWGLTGNPSAVGNFLGTTDATAPFRILVNNQQRVSITSGGLFSVQTGTTPSTGTGNNGVSIGNGNTVNGNQAIAIGNKVGANHLGAVVIGDYSADAPAATNSSTQDQFTSRFNGGYRFFTTSQLDEDAAVYFNNGGNVGLGTSTPTGPFHVAVDKDAVKDSLFIVDNAGNVGVGTIPSGTYKIEINGNIGTAGINEMSDARWKKDITTINAALDMVSKLRGVSYNWRKDEYPSKNFSSDKQIGFIAQELQKVLPELVHEDNNGYLTVEYSKVTAVLTNAINEQQKIIEAQNKKIQELSNEVTDIKEKIGMMSTATTSK